MPPCPTLAFTSRAPSNQLTGLEPGTKVSVWLEGLPFCVICEGWRAFPLELQSVRQAAASSRCADLHRFACAFYVQYNVTVLGVTKTGQRTKGANMMQLTTVAPSLRLTSAKARGPTSGTANATALPPGYFTKASRPPLLWGHSACAAFCRSGSDTSQQMGGCAVCCSTCSR